MNKIKIFVPNQGREEKKREMHANSFFEYYQIEVQFICLRKSEIESNTLTSLPYYLFVHKNIWKSQNDFMFSTEFLT